MRHGFGFAAFCLAWCLGTAGAEAAQTAATLAGLNVEIWSPDEGPSPYPVIIFSHGFHGCATQSTFLMEALAKDGYIVFAPNHKDATCDGGAAHWRDRASASFRDADAWTDKSFEDRRQDIDNLIAAIKADDRFRKEVDWTHFGLIGHSLGGYTVVALAGAWPGWKLDGVKAVLALSPYVAPFIAQGTLKDISVPIMYQGGTMDFGITPSVAKPDGAYDQSPAPKYFVEFERASHFAWTDMRAGAHDEIVAYGLAFMDHYVRGLPAKPILTDASGVSDLRYASDLGNSAAKAGAP